MQSIFARAQVLNGSESRPAPHCLPNKSSPFQPPGRERDKPLNPYTTVHSKESSHTVQPTYSDVYLKSSPTVSTYPSNSKGRNLSLSMKTSSRAPRQERPDSSKISVEPSYVFPSFDIAEDILTPRISTSYSRPRSRTGPSGSSNWETSTSQLCLSGSSSTQHTETPPRTPVDFNISKESLEQFPVVVTAPISGVEMMDALVDGMNGGDDVLSNGASISDRTRFSIPGHHPLYQPPLPTPPPGVVLGRGKIRNSKPKFLPNYSSDSEHDEDHRPTSTSQPHSRSRLRRTRPHLPRTSSNPIIPLPTSVPTSTKRTLISSPRGPMASEKPKTVVPSISEIIQAHIPFESRLRSSTTKPASHDHDEVHSGIHEAPDSDPEPLILDEEAEVVSRSSIDSVADEVQRTLRNQLMVKPRPQVPPPSSFMKRHSTISDNASIYSPCSDPGVSSSRCSSSIRLGNYQPSPFDVTSSFVTKPSSASQEVAQYLRSTRLTTLLRLTRSPHASQDHPLTVSLSDLGSSTGYPVVVFLGLGCVRHIMGLYDEMAEILNLRLITIDRWGLGRTESRSKTARGIVQWASVVEEVLDLLHIDRCSILAHSAGAPYALSFANKVPERICGDICLLAPWVGGSENNGYKWLKYVPNGLLKTAQAAEWKVQAWMIGKPPSIVYEGIGYNATPQTPVKSPSGYRTTSRSNRDINFSPTPPHENHPRPSVGSSNFSEYDDLRDFDGRFESRSTLGASGAYSLIRNPTGDNNSTPASTKKPSRGFLNRLKGSLHSPQSVTSRESLPGGRGLKALRSMSSLKSRSMSSKRSRPPSPQLPPSPQVEVDFGLDGLNWIKSSSDISVSEGCTFAITPRFSTTSHPPYGRSSGRRSISFTSPSTTSSLPTSPDTHSFTSNAVPGNTFQAALGNSLIAASHSESAKGTHNDLLQILNHENHPWGFSYSSYPHNVKVWYGDKDEKIAENAVRWMARNMGEDKCSVKVVKGADHGLMYRSSVVVEVLEQVLAFWEAS